MPEPEMHVDSTAAGQDTRALEALFFVSDEPITASVLAQALDVDRRTVEDLCDRLAKELDDRGSGLVLRNVRVGGGCTRTRTPRRSWSSSSCPPVKPA